MDEKKIRVVGEQPLWDEELRGWFERYINEHSHHSTEILSRSQYTGVPRAMLEDYLEGLFYLPSKSGGAGNSREKYDIEEAIRRFRENVEGTVRHNYANNFVETNTWVQIQNACNTAIKENIIVLIYGKPGLGKTRCLIEYSKRNMSTAPISVLCSRNITPGYFVEKLARKISLTQRGIIPKLEDDIAERLKRNPRPLFVDQANYLNEQSLGTLCYIWEVARIPIVLAGTKSLYDLFMASNLTQDVRAQLSSRVAMHYPLSTLLLPEAKAILKRAMGDDATDEVMTQIFNITGGIHRHVDMIIPRIFELKARNAEELAAGKVKLSVLISKAGAKLMLG